MWTVIVAEKPSVARDIAEVVGAKKKQEGYLEGNGYRVTWAIGHLVGLPEPHQVEPQWKRWSWSHLPMLPDVWPLQVIKKTRSQFNIVQRLLRARQTSMVVAATDAGREGELIFRYIYERADVRTPVKRLWISSLTTAAIQQGLDRLKDGAFFDPLADAAKARSRADWLVGMNLSRAYSLAHGDTLSVGRVQTPTLAMLVERELAVRSFVPEHYFEVQATFCGADDARYDGTWFQPGPVPKDGASPTRLAADGRQAKAILSRAEAAQGRSDGAQVASVDAEDKRMPSPRLYDLTELQRHANRLFGFSAKKTLQVAQSLYEKHKAISYPRTDSRHLSQEEGRQLPQVVEAIAGQYEGQLAEGTGQRPLGRRFIDDSEVGDHHAIIPTSKAVHRHRLSGDEEKVYDLVCRRLLQAWHQDYRWRVTTVVTVIETKQDNGAVQDHFRSTGRAIEQLGWKILDPPSRADAQDKLLPAGLEAGQSKAVVDATLQDKQTRPPKHYTDATLLSAMETAGRTLDDRELSRAMKECGLGTPATRAQVIETLLQRDYVHREKRALRATDKGIALIEVVHPEVKSPALTGGWEARLGRIAQREHAFETFMSDIEEFVRQRVAEVAAAPPGRSFGEKSRAGAASSAGTGEVHAHSRETARRGGAATSTVQRGAGAATGAHRAASSSRPRTSSRGAGAAASSRHAGPAPRSLSNSGRPDSHGPTARSSTGGPGDQPAVAARTAVVPKEAPMQQILRDVFGFPSFRANQEAVCDWVRDGKPALLVMPTGAGKSLCYQLPGLARGGTTVVLSPLIALMEDQVAKLQAMGLAAERIHSGRSRQQSREVCRAYLLGALDYLFIAPERLGVPGFPEMLGKRPPTLIAVDEAHCISQWGHDFRPDYRMLQDRLPLMGDAPVLALTATATPRVQQDIMGQLGADKARRFIHGFRRTNIAVEVAEIPVPDRPERVETLLSDPERRPAIVYAPTRKAAEELASRLNAGFPARPYHAGLSVQARERSQAEFQSGAVEVVVATIAFGMGIDKADVRTVVHTALPGTVEGYYQEIGRAGRDGAPSIAVLLHSFADRRTHEFFFERDHPDPKELARLAKKLSSTPMTREDLAARVRLDQERFDRAFDKLQIHGGLRVDAQGGLTAGDKGWRKRYEVQRAHRIQQMEDIAAYASSQRCRMLQLVQHFGDQEDSGEVCGQCDVCAPDSAGVQRFRAPTDRELLALGTVLDALAYKDGQAVGRLYEAVGPAWARRAFEVLLRALERADLVLVETHAFEKEGRTISYRRVRLTGAGRRAAGSPAAIVQQVQLC